MKEEAWNGNNRGKWSLWASIGLVVVLIIILFLYLALKGPNYDEQYSTKDIVNPAEGLSLEQAVEKFDESFVYYLLFSIKAYNLHNPPLSGNSPKMEIFVGNEQYNSIINKGKIEIGRGDLEKEDIIIRMTTEEAVKMIMDTNYIIESFSSGKSGIEMKAEKSTLFAKGYLKLYEELTGKGISGNVIKIYLD